ncbi:MAG: 2-oxoacid:acceptor oxidoreductase subunit alpha [Candidatus Lokiarchaeota archaeon]|nr:2-oxoacid:acceptor oxidoreductase subunit alpha [Candidatus Lokiarchaeota archaeon]
MGNPNYNQDLSIVLCGAAGQGIQTVEALLTKSLKKSGFYVFATREYMSRVRGGVNSTTIRVSSKAVRAYVDRIDVLIPLSDQAVPHLKERISQNTLIIGEKRFIDVIPDLASEKIEISFEELSKSIGGKIYANIVALGAIMRLFKADNKILHSLLSEIFKSKGQEIIENNIKASDIGYETAESLIKSNILKKEVEIQKNPEVTDDYIIDGTQAIGLGAIAGGCNFACFYPMAPSTGIGTFLAQHALDFDIIVDQSEDEISVINKALGASYAGARAFISTAGGGFSLMSEGISLAGMTELPLVIVVGMRPGPATGMPTRTCQEDIELVLYSGAGFFPKVIFAPGSIEDAFSLTQRAFNITQQYHVPVFILPDQYLVDSYYNINSLNLDSLVINKNLIKTDSSYERYRFTESGISPRGVPGYGEGLVDADSHTHNEKGEITEDPIIRKKTVQKRFKKLGLLRKIALPPEFIGNENFKYLVISWGSNYYLIKEALEMLYRDDVGFLFFRQIYPVHKAAFDYLIKAEIKISIEQNPTGQFGKLLENETHINMNHRILKHSGYTFSVEEIHDKLKKVIEGDENIE